MRGSCVRGLNTWRRREPFPAGIFDLQRIGVGKRFSAGGKTFRRRDMRKSGLRLTVSYARSALLRPLERFATVIIKLTASLHSILFGNVILHWLSHRVSPFAVAAFKRIDDRSVRLTVKNDRSRHCDCGSLSRFMHCEFKVRRESRVCGHNDRPPSSPYPFDPTLPQGRSFAARTWFLF